MKETKALEIFGMQSILIHCRAAGTAYNRSPAADPLQHTSVVEESIQLWILTSSWEDVLDQLSCQDCGEVLTMFPCWKNKTNHVNILPVGESAVITEDWLSGRGRALCTEQKDVDWVEDDIRIVTLPGKTNFGPIAGTSSTAKACTLLLKHFPMVVCEIETVSFDQLFFGVVKVIVKQILSD